MGIEDNNYNDIPSYTTFDINFDYTVNDHVDAFRRAKPG